jgi:UPF0755 protein
MRRLGRIFLKWYEERTADLAITLAGLLIVLLATAYVHFWAPPGLDRHSKIVAIQAGTNFHEIAKVLEDNGIIRDHISFYLLARLQKAIPKVKAGEYEVDTGMKPQEVLSKMVRGDVLRYPVTIPEGFNIFEIGEILEEAGICLKENFLRRAKDYPFIVSLGLDVENLEGYLFPDTYNFPKVFGEENAIRQMVSRFKTVYGSLEKRAAELGLSRNEVVTLASMIEKEAMDDQERELISAVFRNRLQRGMALQSDPTAVYGVKMAKSAKKEKITREDLQTKSPYNTYHVSGLPKGPIANPGLKSLQAVLYPADVNYIYFVSKNDRTHHFSRTLEEHNRAVAKYQRKGKKEAKAKSANQDT